MNVEVLCCEEMCEYFRSVNTLPIECIVRHGVYVAPAYFARYEVLNACFFEYLRKSCTVTENIGYPQCFGLLAELVANEFLTSDELSYKAFAARNIAIRLKPHCALDFPSALFNTFLELLIKLRRFRLEEFIKLRLAHHEKEFRIFLHELKYRTE